MKNRFRFFLGPLMAAVLGMGILFAPIQAGAYQQASTPSGTFITVTYTDPMNVRNGPGTFYDVIGRIFPGDVLPALGISPGREWIQISFSGSADGIGWVYSSYVSVSGGELQVVEPPPTPAPLITSTIDPTLAAAFHTQPTTTRLPTFTPPAPLTIPQFVDESPPQIKGISFGIFTLVLVLLGALALLLSFIFQK